MASPAQIHLMCGIVASGKTTRARALAAGLPAVRLSRDEWMLRLHGGRYDEPAYVARLEPCTNMLWDLAADVVRCGSSVVLDWNFWSRERRAEAVARSELGWRGVVVHWVDVPVDVAVARADQRRRERAPDAHEIDEAGVRHSAVIFEPPGDAEGIEIRRYT